MCWRHGSSTLMPMRVTRSGKLIKLEILVNWLTFYKSLNYSLERYHVLVCGYSVKCKPHYPEGLYQLLSDNKGMVAEPPFKSFDKCTRCISESLRGVNVTFNCFNSFITNINVYAIY
jgi:hypothetical protein